MIKTAAFLAGALVLTSSALSAQIYPSRPITLIVPFAVGGSNDIVGCTKREFMFFNWLEGRMCTTCAPGDQEKSIEGQCGRGGLAVAQECSDGYHCQPPPQSEITGK
jgi:hypothetical protein